MVLLTTSTSVSDRITSWGVNISAQPWRDRAESYSLRTSSCVDVCTVLRGTPIPSQRLLLAQTPDISRRQLSDPRIASVVLRTMGNALFSHRRTVMALGEYQKALRYFQVHPVLPDTHANKQPFASEYVALRTPIQLNAALCASKVAQASLKARVASLAQTAQGQTTSVTRASKSTTGMPLSVLRIASVVLLTFARRCTRKQRPDQVMGGRNTRHWTSDLLALRSGDDCIASRLRGGLHRVTGHADPVPAPAVGADNEKVTNVVAYFKDKYNLIVRQPHLQCVVR
ncbi:hypothetical protein FA10DRAFT_285910 [Acaromyces ingoldii]|uniref:Uncharacterized protein n=1 Tax=Acaromyces ingoldii TaxID=215250 RepID=A0A316YR04_9BASI|nr:hypothetical protein FA10DRAFT_285910 [Acaromyces ingoldii]PWN90195.1 hypothetical protein FA10DRAFT_285910 [Acaromyces ingoldii]